MKKRVVPVHRIIYRVFHALSEKGKVGYVGFSTHGLNARRVQHLRNARLGLYDTPFYRALQKYPNPEIWTWAVLEEGFTSSEAMKSAEIKWIASLDSLRSGYNATRGGDGLVGAPPEVYARIGQILKGRPGPNKGKPMSEAARVALLAANVGRPLSAEHRRKISVLFKGRKLTPEHRIKISETRKARHIRVGMLGKRCSDTTRKKIGDAQRGEKNHAFGKPSWIAGKHHSEETRAKLRAAWVRRKSRAAA